MKFRNSVYVAAMIYLVMFVLSASAAFGAGASTTWTLNNVDTPGLYVYIVDVTADDADGSIDSVTITISDPVIFMGHQQNPGSTGPTDGAWDYYLTSADGLDILSGGGEDRSATATEYVTPTSKALESGDYVFSAADNLVNSATSEIKFYFLVLR